MLLNSCHLVSCAWRLRLFTYKALQVPLLHKQRQMYSILYTILYNAVVRCVHEKYWASTCVSTSEAISASTSASAPFSRSASSAYGFQQQRGRHLMTGVCVCVRPPDDLYGRPRGLGRAFLCLSVCLSAYSLASCRRWLHVVLARRWDENHTKTSDGQPARRCVK